MLAKQNRLTGQSDFKRVQDSGKIYQYSTFGIAIYDRKDEMPPRFGIVISTKISKDAVTRNLYKRIISECVRINVYNAKKGLDIVFLGKGLLLKTPSTEITREVKKALLERGIVS